MITKVDRVELLNKLQDNRTNHKQTFETAYENYSDKLVKDLQEALKNAKAKKSVRIYSSLPIPEDHTEDYDSVISLLEMSQEATIELDDQDVRKYVLDRWEWERSFAANTMSYVSHK
jgi:hypothetical protein